MKTAVCFALLAATAIAADVPKWGQCGGNGYTGATKCADGECVKISDFFSQCQPVATPAPSVIVVPKVAKWGQCGGLGYTGATECADSECVKVSDLYSQCQPVATAAPSVIVTSAPSVIVEPTAAPSVIVEPTAAPSIVVTPAPSVVVTPAPSVVVTPAPSVIVTPTVNKWAQCGGLGYTGPTACKDSKCVKISDLYSQCQ